MRVPALALGAGITILHGDNAQGKTNFLEAVYFCALGRPLRADHSRELIPMGADTAHVRASFVSDTGAPFTVDAHIAQNGSKSVKSISIDRQPVKNTRELFGRVPIVSFAPEDLRLVKEGPALRRKFMDIEICQLSPVYYQELKDYYRALRQRNHLLKLIQKNRAAPDYLAVWDDQLITHGSRIMRTRAAFIEKISALAAQIHQQITQHTETLTLTYKTQDEATFAAALQRNQRRDIALGTTATGIHRDDIQFNIQHQNARTYASQGQTRTAVLSTKLAEIALIQERTSTTPILLLDDVFSELDTHRQQFLLKQVGGIQVLLTCTGVDGLLKDMNAKKLNMNNGKIKE